eukprot:scaffold185326_cov33-Tisochrysis_lutea.AAC.4
MLAREYCEAAKIKLKPIILSHHMLYGLVAGQASESCPAICMAGLLCTVISRPRAVCLLVKPSLNYRFPLPTLPRR